MRNKLKWYERGLLDIDRTMVRKLLLQVEQLPEILNAETVIVIDNTFYTFKRGISRSRIIEYLQSLKGCRNPNACNITLNQGSILKEVVNANNSEAV